MSALGQKRTCAVQLGMSALPPKADVRRTRLLDHGLRLFVSKGPDEQQGATIAIYQWGQQLQ